MRWLVSVAFQSLNKYAQEEPILHLWEKCFGRSKRTRGGGKALSMTVHLPHMRPFCTQLLRLLDSNDVHMRSSTVVRCTSHS